MPERAHASSVKSEQAMNLFCLRFHESGPYSYWETDMAIVTTRKNQLRVSEAALRVGGYEQLLRLAEEHKRLRGSGKLSKDEHGHWTFRHADSQG